MPSETHDELVAYCEETLRVNITDIARRGLKRTPQLIQVAIARMEGYYVGYATAKGWRTTWTYNPH
jgi:hypothetical protein